MLLADADRFEHRVRQPLALVANVRDVHGVGTPQLLTEREQFIGRGKCTRGVDQSGAHAPADGVGARSSMPIAAMRSAPWPTSGATLVEGRAESKRSRKLAKSDQRQSRSGPTPRARSRNCSARPGSADMGAGEKPHSPTTSVVTP